MDVEQIKLIASQYDLIADRLARIGMFVFLGWFVYKRPHWNKNSTPAIFCIPSLVAACAHLGFFAHLFIKYFGISPVLTFGFRIGGILPSTCEASMPIEGKDGLPCSLKRFLKWTGRATRRDGSWHLDELEPQWRDCMFWVGFMVSFTVMNLAMVLFVMAEQRRTRKMKKLDTYETWELRKEKV